MLNGLVVSGIFCVYLLLSELAGSRWLHSVPRYH